MTRKLEIVKAGEEAPSRPPLQAAIRAQEMLQFGGAPSAHRFRHLLGDKVWVTSRGSVKDDMSRSGDVMVYKKGTTSGRTKGSTLSFGALEVFPAWRHYQHAAFASPGATF